MLVKNVQCMGWYWKIVWFYLVWFCRPLVKLFKKSGYIELSFTINAGDFKDSQSLQDSVVEEFQQVCYIPNPYNFFLIVIYSPVNTCTVHVCTWLTSSYINRKCDKNVTIKWWLQYDILYYSIHTLAENYCSGKFRLKGLDY